MTDTSTDAAREKAYIDALGYAKKALDVDPKNGAAQAQATSVKADLTKIVAAHITVIQRLIAASKFVDAPDAGVLAERLESPGRATASTGT